MRKQRYVTNLPVTTRGSETSSMPGGDPRFGVDFFTTRECKSNLYLSHQSSFEELPAILRSEATWR